MNKTRRIILISAKSNINEQITGLRLGAVAYITKPFDPLYLKARFSRSCIIWQPYARDFPIKKPDFYFSLRRE